MHRPIDVWTWIKWILIIDLLTLWIVSSKLCCGPPFIWNCLSLSVVVCNKKINNIFNSEREWWFHGYSKQHTSPNPFRIQFRHLLSIFKFYIEFPICNISILNFDCAGPIPIQLDKISFRIYILLLFELNEISRKEKQNGKFNPT